MLQQQYKDVLLNKKCLRHSINRVQSKDHRIGTYEINKIFLSCFDNKIYIQKKWMLWIISWVLALIVKNSYHKNYPEKLFCEANVLFFSLVRAAFLSSKMFLFSV